MKELVFLKLGGSLITDKTRPRTPRPESLARLAGEIADGFHVHPLHTPRYLREVLLPAIQLGAARAGRSRDDIKIAASPFVVSGAQDDPFVRAQIAFYASTPSYKPVMALHGWEQFAERLSGHAARGEWGEMPALISDEMLATFAVVAPAEELRAALEQRYSGLADRLTPYMPFTPGERDAFWGALLKQPG
mgnify:CR=1 FL=1